MTLQPLQTMKGGPDPEPPPLPLLSRAARLRPIFLRAVREEVPVGPAPSLPEMRAVDADCGACLPELWGGL